MEKISQTILIVDDDTHLLEGLTRLLHREFEVLTATSGPAGLRALQNEGPLAVIVADFKMPGMNGVEFLQEVYRRDPDIVRVMLTEFHDVETVLAAINDAHIYRFLGKPCPAALLQSTLRDCLEQYRLIRAERALTDELRLANAALDRARDNADAANLSKSAFLANMSHEIRTPMTAILGFAQNLLDLELPAAERLNNARTICRNGEHLLQLINDILDISKIEAGKLEVERIRCSPVQVVAEVQSLMQVGADAKRLPMHVEFIGRIPETIETDPTRLRQILVNLLGNAIKFTEAGSVRLVTRIVEGPALQFEVIDTGIGMTPAQLQRLFQPFAQADSSKTRRFGGTGLGLTISRRLAEMLGGTVTVNSASGEGSAFTVTIATGALDGIPLLDNPTQALTLKMESPSAPQPEDLGLDCRILLAEDGPDNQRLITHLLRKAGAEVTVAENGRQAVEAALAAHNGGNPFDVILMDMQMPVMDGYEASALLRAKGYRGAIVAFTAHAMASDREKCLAAGCDEYASKPIDRGQLLATIRRQLEKQLQRKPETVGPPPALFSELAEERDLADLLAEFVEGLPRRVDALQEALDRNDLAGLARLAHQLRGAAGSYGFSTITTAARAVEESAQAPVCLDELRRQFEALAALCRSAHADQPRGTSTAEAPTGELDCPR